MTTRLAASPSSAGSKLRMAFLGWSQDLPRLVVFLAMMGILAFFILYPLGTLFVRSFYIPGMEGITLRNYGEFLFDQGIFSSFLNTIYMAAVCVPISLFFALPLAWGVARTEMPFRNFIRVMVVLTFATPSFLGAIGWITLLGPRAGKLNVLAAWLFGLQSGPFDVFGFWGMTFVMATYVYPFLFYSVSAALENMDVTYEQSANLLGASNAKVMIAITLPLVMPAILSGMILVILEAFIVFGVPAILANPVQVHTLATKVYELFASDPPRFDMAATTAVPIVVITALLLLFQRLFLGSRQYVTISGKAAQPQPIDIGKWRYPLAAYSLLVVTVSLVLPVGALFSTSFLRVLGEGWTFSNLTLQNYLFLFSASRVTGTAFVNSFFLALGAAVLAVAFAFLMAWFVERSTLPGREGLSLLAMVALSIPGVAFGVCLVLAFSGWPLPLYGTIWIFLVGYSVKGLPLSYMFARSALKQISEELEQSARALGCSWLRTMWEVTLPLMKRGLLSIGTIVFCIMFRNMPISILIYVGGLEVVAVVILEFLEEGNMPVVSAMATLVLAINIGLIVLSRRLVGKGAFEV